MGCEKATVDAHLSPGFRGLRAQPLLTVKLPKTILMKCQVHRRGPVFGRNRVI